MEGDCFEWRWRQSDARASMSRWELECMTAASGGSFHGWAEDAKCDRQWLVRSIWLPNIVYCIVHAVWGSKPWIWQSLGKLELLKFPMGNDTCNRRSEVDHSWGISLVRIGGVWIRSSQLHCNMKIHFLRHWKLSEAQSDDGRSRLMYERWRWDVKRWRSEE